MSGSMNDAANTFTVGLVTLRSGLKPKANFDVAAKLIREAKDAGADYILTPEMTNVMESRRDVLFEALAEDDASLDGFRDLARALKRHLHIGSLAVKVSHERIANRSFLIDPLGEIIATYDKIHMFDVDLGGGESYRESSSYQPGESGALVDLPWGKLGMSICYDLRFPALYRALAESGASFLTVPAAFTKITGEAHWHVLLRARAIENGSFVFAAAQGGLHENGRETFGHSLIVDPWGAVLAEGGTQPSVTLAKIDPARVDEARRRIPSLQHGRRFTLGEAHSLHTSHLHLVRSKP
jgi:predicted amidohydrolase